MINITPFSNQQPNDFTSSSLYIEVIIQGFTLQIHPDIAQHPPEAQQLYIELEKQLKAVTEIVPANSLYLLQQVIIWVEWDNKCKEAARYHPSRSWLEENGVNPDKAQCVEINTALKFIQWSDTQPWMVLHELAHAYHFQVLGENNKNIQRAFQQAKEKKRYESIKINWIEYCISNRNVCFSRNVESKSRKR